MLRAGGLWSVTEKGKKKRGASAARRTRQRLGRKGWVCVFVLFGPTFSWFIQLDDSDCFIQSFTSSSLGIITKCHLQRPVLSEGSQIWADVRIHCTHCFSSPLDSQCVILKSRLFGGVSYEQLVAVRRIRRTASWCGVELWPVARVFERHMFSKLYFLLMTWIICDISDRQPCISETLPWF